MLITSRNPDWGDLAQVVDVNVFTPAEAVAFFQERLGREGAEVQGSGSAREQLAEMLGYLPLALEQAAAYMVTREVTVADYVRLYQTRWRELMARAKRPDAYHATVMTTWQISFEQIEAVPGAAELLALCCFLGA